MRQFDWQAHESYFIVARLHHVLTGLMGMLRQLSTCLA